MKNISKNFNITEVKGTAVIGNKVFINGRELPPCPGKGHNSTIIDGKVYLNGWEWVEGKDGNEGKWRKTIKAFWHKLF